MKKNNYISMALMATGLLATVSCTDFDDYNKVENDALPSASQTLWENIRQNDQLSDFADLVEKSGFSQELGQTKYYTVWAPLNGTFDASAFRTLESSALMRQFVQNHIASYAHSATGKIDERILMLNEKSYNFEGSSSYTFDDVTLNAANLPSSNGLLHTLNGVATFYPNLYEYVTDSVLAGDIAIDSLRHFFQKYELTYLDTEASVVGSIVNGMQTYVDSVMVTTNTLWSSLNAKINNEDSTYTFIMPTNQAWTKAYDRIKSYYNYLTTTYAQAFVSTNIASTNANITIDNAYWQDSLVSRYLTRNLIYSNNDAYNQWMEKTPSQLGTDTLRTTTRRKLSNPADILAQTTAKLKMSNGVARVVDSLAFLPWETYAPELTYNAAGSSNQARIVNANTLTVNVENPDPAKVDVEELSKTRGTLTYLWVEPNGGYAKPELDIYLTDVLSTTYDIYCVFVPQNVERGDTSVTKPNRVVFTLNYCDENGKLKDYTFKDESEENSQWFDSYYEDCKNVILADNPKQTFSKPDAATLTAFSNDVTKVDTLYVGEFTFPVTYYGLSTSDKICPNLKITSPFSVFNKALLEGFSRDLRIASIILKPKELAEYEESNKQ
mgnify:CR=1 FL=1